MTKKQRIRKKQYKRFMKSMDRVRREVAKMKPLSEEERNKLREYVYQKIRCNVVDVKCDNTNNTLEDLERGIISVDVSLSRSVDFIDIKIDQKSITSEE